MEYRKLPHGNEEISVLGFGTSAIGEASEEEIIATVQMAIENGINYFDLASGHANTFEAFGKASLLHFLNYLLPLLLFLNLVLNMEFLAFL